MTRAKKRVTLEDARKLYPDQWVVFVEPRIDEKTTTFVDGVLFCHCSDQREAYARTARLRGARARFFTGSIPYRAVTLTSENEIDEKAA